MNLSVLFSLTLALMTLASLGTVVWLVRQAMEMAEQNTSSMVAIQSTMSHDLRDQLLLTNQLSSNQMMEAKQTLLESLKIQQSVTIGQFQEMMKHNEILLNRMLAKDALAAQALDSTLNIARSQTMESNSSSESDYAEENYNSDVTDEEELANFSKFAKTGQMYIPPQESEDFIEDMRTNLG